jgi:glycyl-tRNA synthetase
MDRATFALLDLFYNKKDVNEGKTTLEIPYHMAPIPITVMPLTNKLHKQAYELYRELQEEFILLYDKSGSVGKRYLRADSIGVPFCVTYDFDTLEKDQAVTVRDRNTCEQKRVLIADLDIVLKKLLQGKKKFEDL